MDKTLAEIYGTNQVDEADVEKLAAAELAEKLAGDENVDLASMSPEDIESLAAQVLAGDDETEETETEETEKQAGAEDEETLAKIAEADKAGRIMAHAFHHELRAIEADGNEKVAFISKSPMGVAAGLAAKGRNAAGHVAAAAKKAGGKAKAFGAKASAKAKETGGKVAKHVKDNKKTYGAGAGAAAVGGAAGFAAGRKSKTASALDTLALQRAQEILEASGIELNAEETTEKQASSKAEVLAQAVEARAWEFLAAHGVVPADENTEE